MSGSADGSRAGLRFGLIGCGGIGELRARALRKAGFRPPVAVSDADGGRAKALAARHGAAAEADWRALVGRDDLDAVIICTPHSLHAEMGVAALQAGRHVLCEKPIARTPAEGRRMVEAADRAGRLLAVGFNFRFLPPVLKARELLDAGVIGTLSHVRAYGGYSAKDLSPAWVRDVEVSGGGALHDVGIHLLDLTQHFLGGVAEARGVASDRVWQIPGCEDVGFAVLRGPTGAIASVGASWAEWRRYHFGLELHGTLGCLEVSCFPMETRVTWAAERGGPVRRRRHRFLMTRVKERLFSYRSVVVDSFALELRAFAREVGGQPTALAKGDEGLQSLEIAHAIGRGAARPDVLHGSAL
jgi:predicted dehydrogenase